jgi:hypothetical protein
MCRRRVMCRRTRRPPDRVESDGAAELPPLQARHVKLLPLAQRLHLHCTANLLHIVLMFTFCNAIIIDNAPFRRQITVVVENGSDQTLRKPAVLLLLLLLLRSAKFTTLYISRTAHARGVFFSVRSGAVVSQDHSAVSVSTVRLGVQFRRPKAPALRRS